jgi:hypothetical protein
MHASYLATELPSSRASMSAPARDDEHQSRSPTSRRSFIAGEEYLRGQI